MDKSQYLVIFLLLINGTFAEYEKVNDHIEYEENSWRPILGPYKDRLKPLKVTPKYEDKYLLQGIGEKPYASTFPIQGLYTFPYYAYSYMPPHATALGSYINNYDYNYYIRKHEKPYVPEYKN
ncbi:unnamed protein product [Arctia plantaginis]|uniref:Uncharacterized protein n=1 Tax=Arctia plantaginis TaxID=874455 RepID=A0A8S0ZNQ2_ARCPL|nr:unnamed protein product [Arctia plantaginis]